MFAEPPRPVSSPRAGGTLRGKCCITIQMCGILDNRQVCRCSSVLPPGEAILTAWSASYTSYDVLLGHESSSEV